MKLTRCRICNESLRDEKSIKDGIGPKCAKRLTKFYAAVETTAEQVAALAVIGDGAAARHLRLAEQSVGAGRPDQARFFFERALEAAARSVALEQAEAAEALAM